MGQVHDSKRPATKFAFDLEPPQPLGDRRRVRLGPAGLGRPLGFRGVLRKERCRVRKGRYRRTASFNERKGGLDGLGVLGESAVKLLGFHGLSSGPQQVDLEGNELPQRRGPSLLTDAAHEIFNPR